MHEQGKRIIELGDGGVCDIDPVSMRKCFFTKSPAKFDNHWGWINPLELVSVLVFPEIELSLS